MTGSLRLTPAGTPAMPPPSRRTFLGASLAALASAPLIRADAPGDAAPPKTPDDPAFQPSTLFLTWQRDPTTTMTVQWVGAAGETSDTKVAYAPLQADRAADSPGKADNARQAGGAGCWGIQEAAARPYPQSDLKVFRAELTGLTPGTDYQFRIGKQSPTYRFRTMPAKATDTIHFISGGDCGVNAHAVGQQHPGGPAGPDVRGHRRRPGLRQRPVGRDQPGVPAQLQQAHDRPRRPAHPPGRLHRQPRGGRRLQQASRQGPLLLRPLRRPLPRDGLRHARFRRLPQPGAARHRPHQPHRAATRPTGWKRR